MLFVIIYEPGFASCYKILNRTLNEILSAIERPGGSRRGWLLRVPCKVQVMRSINKDAAWNLLSRENFVLRDQKPSSPVVNDFIIVVDSIRRHSAPVA